VKRWLAVSALTVCLGISAQPVSAADQISDGQWFHQFLNSAQAHQITRGEGLTVAVIDTGVDATHPDLSGSVLPGNDLVDTQGDGRTDLNGHGTKMASLIVSHGRVRGIAPAAQVLPVRTGIDEMNSHTIAAGIKWAVSKGAKVISISAGAGGPESALMRQEVMAAMAADVVVVAAVGNVPGPTTFQFPASYPGVVAVGGVDKAGNHSSISATGAEMVIAAPSDDISGAHRDGKYGIGSGTSDATAIVAGAVALVRARFPQLKATEVVRRLTATAIDKGAPGRDPEYGFGVLNIVGALTADVPAATSSPTAKVPGAAPPDEPGRFSWWLLIVVLGVIAAVVITAVVIGAVLWSRRRGRSTQPGP
jgi:type VII secretion-associated serine protease mycosin